MIAELRSAVREQTDGRFEILGEVAPDPRGGSVYLARGTWDGSLAILSAARDPNGLYVIEVSTELDDTLVTLGAVCVVCGTASTDHSPNCAVCGTRMEFDDVDPMPDQPWDEILRVVRHAAGDDFDVVGGIPRAGGRGSLFFAREVATSRLVTLSLRREGNDAGDAYLSVGITQLLKVPDERRDASGREAYRPVPVPPTSVKMCPQCSSTFPATVRVCPEDGATLLFATGERSLIGRTIGDHYQIVDEIGSGNFSRVYLAEDIRTRRPCAVKLINADRRGDSDNVERFLVEASAARRIQHENVAQVYDFGESAEGLYLAMEHVEGETLATILDREAPLPVWRAVDIARQIAGGLAAANAHGVLHRDLKPRNVMVAATAESDLVRLVDFGTARVVQGDAGDASRPGYVIGSLEFQSPEQLMGSAIDARSDIYSLGCILFEMLAGQRVFGGPDGPLSIGRRMTEDAPRVRSINPEVPEVIDEIVAMALSREPAMRFQSAASFRDALAQGINGVTVEEIVVGGGWEVVETEPRAGWPSEGGTPVEVVDAGRPFAPSIADHPIPAPVADVPAREGGWAGRSSRKRRPLLPIAVAVSAAAFVGFFTISSGKVPLDAGSSSDQVAAAAVLGENSAAEADLSDDTATAAAEQESIASSPGRVAETVTTRGAAAMNVASATPSAAAPRPESPSTPVVERPALAVETPAPSPPAVATPMPAAVADPGVAGSAVDAAVQRQLETGLARLASALESRDVNRVTTAYPGITDAERNAWVEFFQNNPTVQVQVSDIGAAPGGGEIVQVPFTLTINYAGAGGSQESWVQQNRATFVRRGDGWRIEAIREAQ